MATALKDQFFQRPFFERLAAAIGEVFPGFDRRRFLALVYDDAWPLLALKARMRHAAEALGATLPSDYRQALGILMAVEARFQGFDHLLFADFVERFGVEDLDASAPALEVLTRTSAEFAVRPFIRHDPERMMRQMVAWASHPDEHVRRLSSEGCRPRLPWGTALEELKEDPSPILPILERLKDDPSEAVRRSVANNLGDIAKDHPDLAVSIGARWVRESESRNPLVKHALRDLLKKGHRGALGLFGVAAGPAVRVDRLTVAPKRVPLGGGATLRIAGTSTATRRQRLRLEYALTYARPGGRTARKVFQIAQIDLEVGEGLDLLRKLDFADRSIRKHYAGKHALTLIINGREVGSVGFTLVGRTPSHP